MMQSERGRRIVAPVAMAAVFTGIAAAGLWKPVAAATDQEKEVAQMTEQRNTPVKGIGLIMLGVRNLEQSIGFYRDKVGLELKSHAGGFAFFDGGGTTLALSEELGRARDHKGEAVEVVLSVADVSAAHDTLTARGVTFHTAPRIVTGQQWSANFTDPDGHELSIFGPSSAATPEGS